MKLVISILSKLLGVSRRWIAVADDAVVKTGIDRADVVSFDIFDTALVRRTCITPADIFRRVERQSGQDGFAAARIAAEQLALSRMRRRRGMNDVGLDAIYEFIEPRYRGLMECEIREEQKALVANPRMHSLYRYAREKGRTVCFASDMYMPRRVLERALRENGYEKGDVHVSCEIGGRKSDGGMFAFLKTHYRHKKILHIGDNFASDFVAARVMGVRACYCVAPREGFFAEFPFVERWLSMNDTLAAREFAARLIWRYGGYSQMRGVGLSYWRKLGFVCAAPYLLAHVRWLHNNCERDGVDKCLFIARDGYVPCRVFSRLFPTPAAAYLYAPRLLSCLVIGGDGANPDVEGERHAYIRELERRAQAEGLTYEDMARRQAEAYEAYVKEVCGADAVIGVADGPSSSFSAQRLVEAVLGRRVNGYYLQINGGRSRFAESCGRVTAFAGNRNGFLKEFLFSSPEPPVRAMANGAPVYQKPIAAWERQRMHLYSELATGEEDGVLALHSECGYNVDDSWLEAFCLAPSRRDMRQWSSLRVAVDMKHTEYRRLFPEWSANPMVRAAHRMKRFVVGRRLVQVRRSYGGGGNKNLVFSGESPFLQVDGDGTALRR